MQLFTTKNREPALCEQVASASRIWSQLQIDFIFMSLAKRCTYHVDVQHYFTRRSGMSQSRPMASRLTGFQVPSLTCAPLLAVPYNLFFTTNLNFEYFSRIRAFMKINTNIESTPNFVSDSTLSTKFVVLYNRPCGFGWSFCMGSLTVLVFVRHPYPPA